MPSSNVHFRNLTAAHVDDDHGGCGRHSGPLRQGSPHVYVQNRPLVREKDLPSCAGRPDHEPAPHCHVGEGGGSAITTIKRGGVQSAPRKKCTAAGHPVDVATGRASARHPLHHLSPLRLLVPPANPRPSNPHPSGSAARLFPLQHSGPPPPAQAAPHSAAPPPYSVGGFGRRVIGTDGHQGSFHNFIEDITGKAGPHGHMGALGAAQTFFNHVGSSLGDSGVGMYDHAAGDTDGAQISREDAKHHDAATRTMLKGTLGGDNGLVATAGQAAADKLYAREYPAAAGELDQDAAGQVAKAKAGVVDQAYNDPFGNLAVAAPLAGAGRLAALGRLERAAEAARAAGDAGQAARLERAAAALKGGQAGAAAREAREAAARKLSAQGQATLAKAQAAVTKQKERKLNAHRMASPGEMQERWRNGGRGGGHGSGHGQPALAGVSGGGGNSTRAIGRPGVMQMVDGNGDFVGQLRKQPSTLPGVKETRISYTKRPAADAKALRDKFDSKVEYENSTRGQNPRPLAVNRSNFLRAIAKAPDKVKALKKAGLTDAEVDLMKDGGCPKGWQVHHKLPLDDGGTNTADNLVLMKDDPYHLTVTARQKTLTKDMKAGDTKVLDWPIPPGFVYPP